MLNTILPLSKQLISIPSTKENPEALQAVLAIARSQLPGFTIETFEKDGVQSILVYNSPKRPKKFTMLLNAHLDVTPGKDYQFKPEVKGDKLYGMGALDMKSNAACMILVFKEIAKKVSYPLALQLTTDEELGGFKGTKHQVEQGVRTDFVIAGETTNFRIANKSKGIIWLKIVTKGKSAHGAYPWKGENAISMMSAFLQNLQKTYPNPSEEKWVTTINISTITTTNQTLNKIPDDCTVSLDIRYIPEDGEKVIPTIKKLLPKNFTMEVLVKEPAQFAEETDKTVQLLKKTAEDVLKQPVSFHSANGSSDARHFAPVGGKGIEFGALGGEIGSDNEWIDIKSLEKYYEILKKFLLSLS